MIRGINAYSARTFVVLELKEGAFEEIFRVDILNAQQVEHLMAV